MSFFWTKLFLSQLWWVSIHLSYIHCPLSYIQISLSRVTGVVAHQQSLIWIFCPFAPQVCSSRPFLIRLSWSLNWSLILKYLDKVNKTLRALKQTFMELWKTNLDKFRHLAEIPIKYGIDQGDALSPWLLSTRLNPMTQVHIKSGRQISTMKWSNSQTLPPHGLSCMPRVRKKQLTDPSHQDLQQRHGNGIWATSVAEEQLREAGYSELMESAYWMGTLP